MGLHLGSSLGVNQSNPIAKIEVNLLTWLVLKTHRDLGLSWS
jgi:hypothetical protein